MKLLALLAAAAGTLTLAAPAMAACASGPGDSPVITVPKGKELRIMETRLRAEASYLEICTADTPGSTDWHLEYATNAFPFWFLIWTRYAQGADYRLNFLEDRVDGPTHTPWMGMKKTATPYGYTLAWYDAAGPDMPNTIVEVCLYAVITECPGH